MKRTLTWLFAVGVVASLFVLGLVPNKQAVMGIASTVQAGDGLEIHPIAALNTPFRENEANFSQDGRTVYFACGEGAPSPASPDICVSHLTGDFEDADWSEPELLPFPINTPFAEREPMITKDGRHLYFHSNRPGGFGGLDIYVSEMGPDGEWQTPVNLGAPINTRFNDHCFYFVDMETEDEAYMASDRPEGRIGGTDIWHTRKVDGVWTEPENLGPNINSAGAGTHMAIVGPDGRLWVTASRRADSLGEEDQYVSERDANGDWGPLRNLGAPMNTTSNDRCGDFTRDGKFFVFSSNFPEQNAPRGNQDIYFVNFDDLLKSLGLRHDRRDRRHH